MISTRMISVGPMFWNKPTSRRRRVSASLVGQSSTGLRATMVRRPDLRTLDRQVAHPILGPLGLGLDALQERLDPVLERLDRRGEELHVLDERDRQHGEQPDR